MNGGEVERTVNVRVKVGDVHPLPKWKQVVTRCVCGGGFRRSYKMSFRQSAWGFNVAHAMILNPVSLIDCIIAHVGCMADVEFD